MNIRSLEAQESHQHHQQLLTGTPLFCFCPQRIGQLKLSRVHRLEANFLICVCDQVKRNKNKAIVSCSCKNSSLSRNVKSTIKGEYVFFTVRS